MAMIYLDMDVVKEYGFPEATILSVLASELKVKRNPRVLDGWVKMSTLDFMEKIDGALGNSTVRAAVNVLVNEGILQKGKPNNNKDHVMDRTCWYRLAKKGK